MHKNSLIKAFLWLVMITMPIILIAGILIADKNTRQVGFEDLKPIVYLNAEDESYSVGIMDNEFKISGDIVETVRYIYNNTAPWFIKNLTALKDVIEMTTDRFLRDVFQSGQRS